MGARLYNPVTGRFTSVDPVSGGNDNAYNYPNDPVNAFDLDGQRWCWRFCGAADAVHNGLKNPWVQGGITLLACSTGVGCGLAVWGFVALNSYDRWNSNDRQFTARWALGTALDVALARLPISRIRGRLRLGRHGPRYRGPRVKRFPRKYHSHIRRKATRRNLVYTGTSIARSYYVPL